MRGGRAQGRAEGGDRLLGVCSVVHELLTDVQLPDFRCCSGISAPLTRWFGSKRVAAFLQANPQPPPVPKVSGGSRRTLTLQPREKAVLTGDACLMPAALHHSRRTGAGVLCHEAPVQELVPGTAAASVAAEASNRSLIRI